MRVAIFTDTFHQINGVAMVYNRFARWCSGRGYRVEIFTPGDESRGIMDLGSVKVHPVGMVAPVPYYRDLRFDLFPLRTGVLRYFRDTAFDLVHIATQGHMGVLALWIADKCGLPKISCYHTAIPEYARDRFLKVLGDNIIGKPLARLAEKLCWWYQRKLFSSSRLILVPTRSIKEMIDAHLGIPTAFFTRGVDSEAFSPAKRPVGSGSGIRTIYAGRVSIEKNLQLLKKLELPRGEGLLVVGDGPYLRELKRSMPLAEFTGFLMGEDLQQAYARGDIFVFPSKTDTFGNAVLEAMSSGMPVVVTNVLGPKDFVRHGETGFVAADDEEFVRYHRMLVEDDALRARMGHNAREFARSQSWDNIFESQLIGNYRAVIKEHLRESNRSE